MGLFDDVINKAKDGINKIQSTAQEMGQTISLNNRINSLEAKKAMALTAIGQLVYDKFEKGDVVTDDLLQEKVKEIVAYEAEIRILRSELDQAKLEPDAPRSQKAEHMAGWKPTTGFECPSCHAPANIAKYYCVSCGGSLKEAAEAYRTGSNN